MNERIEELAKQASHQSPDGYPVTIPYSNDFVKVFAEKIVRECIEIVQPESYDGDAMTASLNAKVKQIKQRFGVE